MDRQTDGQTDSVIRAAWSQLKMAPFKHNKTGAVFVFELIEFHLPIFLRTCHNIKKNMMKMQSIQVSFYLTIHADTSFYAYTKLIQHFMNATIPSNSITLVTKAELQPSSDFNQIV